MFLSCAKCKWHGYNETNIQCHVTKLGIKEKPHPSPSPPYFLMENRILVFHNINILQDAALIVFQDRLKVQTDKKSPWIHLKFISDQRHKTRKAQTTIHFSLWKNISNIFCLNFFTVKKVLKKYYYLKIIIFYFSRLFFFKLESSTYSMPPVYRWHSLHTVLPLLWSLRFSDGGTLSIENKFTAV